MNAKMEANMSGIDKSVNTTATAKPAMAIMKETPWMKRSSSWKLTDIFWLKVNTCLNQMTFISSIVSIMIIKILFCKKNNNNLLRTLKRIIRTASTTHEKP